MIAITPGDPAGIGPDIVLKLLQSEWSQPLVIIADKNLMFARAQQLGFSSNILDRCDILHVPLNVPCLAGQPTSANAQYVIETLRQAAMGCLNNRFDAMVTGPVNKAIITESGTPFSGHTQFLADIANVARPVMLLMTDRLKVALLTDHLPLSAVPKKVTEENILECVTIIHDDFKNKFKIKNPRIIICGLNPHAGENGHLGKEEQEIMIPAIKKLQQRGVCIKGPAAADTVFTHESLKEADVILAIYHDQGLPVLKFQGFGNAVNVTLGLPFLRTSVDHGTAFDKAGKGSANEGSLKKALQTAIDFLN